MARYQVTTANETTWVRSTYVYGVLLVSGTAAVVGLVLAALSVVTLINPQSGMSGWERVLVGVPTVLDEGLELVDDYLEQQGGLPGYCTDDLPEDDPDYEFCQDLAESYEPPSVPEEADQAIALVRDETLRQIRHGSIGRLVIGVVLSVVAAVIFRRHKHLVALYGKDTRAPATPAITSVVPPPPPA